MLFRSHRCSTLLLVRVDVVNPIQKIEPHPIPGLFPCRMEMPLRMPRFLRRKGFACPFFIQKEVTMERRQLERNMIFYNPGRPGAVFTFAASNFVTPELIQKTRDHLEYETESQIAFVEERRSKERAG